MWLGYNTVRFFHTPDGSLYEAARTFWYTNLDISKRYEKLILYKTFNAEEYPMYENYDGIEVGKTKEVPLDYTGVMGVPITFLDKYNPQQFEIVGFRKGDDKKDLRVNGKCPYFRILIRNKGLQIAGRPKTEQNP
jgi:hypothetical protein